MWHGVTQAQEDRVGRVITLGWLQRLSGLESRHNVPENGNRKCCVYSVPGQPRALLLIAVLAMLCMQWVWLFSKPVTSTTNI